MIVFKNYFKIVKKHLGLIIMFAAISIGISVANTSYNNSSESYTGTNPNLGIINYDSSKLVDNFIEYIDENAEIIEVEDNEKEIQDVLYNAKVDAIIIIPENYTQDFLAGKEPKLEIKKSLQNASTYTELLINKYFKIAHIYSASGMNEDEIISSIHNDLEKEVTIKMYEEKVDDLNKLAIYYSFENYAFLSIFIFIIGTIMCIFNKETIRKRNNISKMKPKQFSNQLFLGHICLTLIIWFVFVLISFLIYKELMFTANALFIVINSLLFAITVTSLSYLIGSLIKKQNVISGIQNVISLGLSFISGCFVPVEFLDKNIVNFSKIFPSYWFIQGNYNIAKMSDFNIGTLKPVFQNYGIILAFGLLYFIISKIINAKKA